MQSVYCAPARRRKMCWWMALLRLAVRWGHMKHEKKRNLFRHIQIENAYLSETNELAGKQLCAQTETKAKWLVARLVMQ